MTDSYEHNLYYDIDGNPCTLFTWARQFENRSLDDADAVWQVAETQIPLGDDEDDYCRVSTVWVGINMCWEPGGLPLIYETMVFGGPVGGSRWLWPTREEAELGHNVAVTQVKLEIIKSEVK